MLHFITFAISAHNWFASYSDPYCQSTWSVCPEFFLSKCFFSGSSCQNEMILYYNVLLCDVCKWSSVTDIIADPSPM